MKIMCSLLKTLLRAKKVVRLEKKFFLSYNKK